MNVPSLLIEVRHAECAGNIVSHDEMANLPMANFEFPLTPRGKLQCPPTGDYVRSLCTHVDASFVSTFDRSGLTLDGMDIYDICPRPTIDSRLDEKYDGIFHALTNEQIDHHFPAGQRLRKKEGWYHFRPPGGRNGPDVELFIHSFEDMLRRDFAGKVVLVVGHGNWLLLRRRIIDNMTAKQVNAMRGEAFPNCSVSVYEGRGDKMRRIVDRFVPWKGKVEESMVAHLA